MSRSAGRCAGLLAALAGGALICFPGSALAADKKKLPPPSPEALSWVKEITHLPPGGHNGLRPVRIDFGLSWNNVLNAGELAIVLEESVEHPETAWVGSAVGRSAGLARLLWPYDVEAESHIDRVTLRPTLFELTESDRGKNWRYRLQFEPARVRSLTVVTQTRIKKGETPPDPEVRNRTYRYEFVQDILSTGLYLRSHDLEKGDTIKIIVSPFNRPYYAAFESLGREERRVKGKKYDTIRLDVKVRKINHDRTLQDYEKMKSVTMWVSDDEYRLPVEVHADIFVGFVSARVNRREWLDGKTAAEPKKGGGFFRNPRGRKTP